MLGATVDLLESDAEAAAIVRARKRWFSVDEYQDTNPLQDRLLSLWAGSSPDVCVVGDEDQTIYSFTGASSSYLLDFAGTHPGTQVVELTENYRSSPEILGLANRLIASTGRTRALTATRPSGPPPTRSAYADPQAELAGLVHSIRARHRRWAGADRDRRPRPAQRPAATDRGRAHDGRDPVCRTRRALLRAPGCPGRDPGNPASEARRDRAGPASGPAGRLQGGPGLDPDAVRNGPEERERAADLGVLLAIAAELALQPGAAEAGPGAAEFLAELARRDAAERANTTGGVTLSTIHRAKGLEWDAVFLPGLEEGTLPIGQAGRRSGRDRRGAPPAVRRDHPGPPLPGDLVGRPARRGERPGRQPPAVPLPGRAGLRVRPRPPDPDRAELNAGTTGRP